MVNISITPNDSNPWVLTTILIGLSAVQLSLSQCNIKDLFTSSNGGKLHQGSLFPKLQLYIRSFSQNSIGSVFFLLNIPFNFLFICRSYVQFFFLTSLFNQFLVYFFKVFYHLTYLYSMTSLCNYNFFFLLTCLVTGFWMPRLSIDFKAKLIAIFI